ncbi:MAG: CoA transferase, partial [Dehalococcoidia bacterium]
MDCGPLDGTTVVDMTHMWAGPTCTQMLGDLGAEVIKVEPPGGDRSRGGIAPKNGWVSPIYLAVNRNKRSIVIDLTKEEGRKVMYRLTERADVFIHNFRQKAVEKLKVSYEILKAINPRLIYASVSGYGAKGPGKDLPGQDLQLQAFGGLVSVTGYPDEPRPSP